MRLDQALVTRKLCESRTEAQEAITRAGVLVNGVVIKKQTKEVVEEDHIEVISKRKFVSRGGEKLEGAFIDVYGKEESIRQHLQGKTAIDIGSSTGGFTDCLLLYGISHVTSVDVGSSQLHSTLRESEKVTLYENTDIRNFPNNHFFDVIVCDLSFISLEKVINTIISFGRRGSEFFLLIKPQFEVGKGNTKKGIVKDKAILSSVLKKYEDLMKEKGAGVISIFPCHITGGDGNQEYFLYSTLT